VSLGTFIKLEPCVYYLISLPFQLQGIKWIKTRYGNKLTVIRLGQKRVMDQIEKAVMSGFVLLIENIGESVDPVLDNLIGRNLIRKGK
jgi:hypothetical protein